jgi:hypothetical protein
LYSYYTVYPSNPEEPENTRRIVPILSTSLSRDNDTISCNEIRLHLFRG